MPLPVLFRKRSKTKLLPQAQAYWKANRYSGSGSLLDLTGHGHDLAFPGGTANPTYAAYTGTRAPYFPGVAGNYLSSPDHANWDITGDIDVRVVARLTDWTPSGANYDFFAKWDGTQQAYIFLLLSGGALTFAWNDPSTNYFQADSTANPTVSDGDILAIRVTVDTNNGASGSDVKFYTKATTEATAVADAESNTGWTQLGSTVVKSTTAGIRNTTAGVEIGSQNAGVNNLLIGRVYATCVKSGIDGTNAGTVNCSVIGPATVTFNDSGGPSTHTWTVNRSASGKKIAVIDRSLLLFGTDDYLEAPDHASLDFDADDYFTLAAAYRTHGTTTGQTILAKGSFDGSTAGYRLGRGSTANVAFIQIHNGVVPRTANVPSALTAGVTSVVVGTRDPVAVTVTAYKDGIVGTPGTGNASDLTTSFVLRLGRLSDVATEYADMEFFSAAIFRRALNQGEISRLTQELLQ